MLNLPDTVLWLLSQIIALCVCCCVACLSFAMGDESSSGTIPTEDLLGLGDEQPSVRLRPNQPVNRRSEGVIFGDDFQVSAEQEATDKELVKQVYSGQ